MRLKDALWWLFLRAHRDDPSDVLFVGIDFRGIAKIPIAPLVLLLLMGIVLRRSGLPAGNRAEVGASSPLATA